MNIHLETLEEFESLFDGDNPTITLGIFEGIREALEKNTEEAELFNITFEESDDLYEISLDSEQWGHALDNCLEKFEKFEMYDEAIDTFQLKKRFYSKYGFE